MGNMITFVLSSFVLLVGAVGVSQGQRGMTCVLQAARHSLSQYEHIRIVFGNRRSKDIISHVYVMAHVLAMSLPCGSVTSEHNVTSMRNPCLVFDQVIVS